MSNVSQFIIDQKPVYMRANAMILKSFSIQEGESWLDFYIMILVTNSNDDYNYSLRRKPETYTECNIHLQSSYDYPAESGKSNNSNEGTLETSKKFKWKRTRVFPLVDKNWIELEEYSSVRRTMKYFKTFISDDMILLLADQTNLNAEQIR
ncbi:hypothetical protein Tsp_05220 [Trichinella spiralis]|uniref:hypothetical protein n=1 Tax=Trichinella spiralis TaxID=6334 RepID=UPI0001EFD7DB|nr:hypothetical protein Tsp_05220 [Trichinella spiralis]